MLVTGSKEMSFSTFSMESERRMPQGKSWGHGVGCEFVSLTFTKGTKSEGTTVLCPPSCFQVR